MSFLLKGGGPPVFRGFPFGLPFKPPPRWVASKRPSHPRLCPVDLAEPGVLLEVRRVPGPGNRKPSQTDLPQCFPTPLVTCADRLQHANCRRDRELYISVRLRTFAKVSLCCHCGVRFVCCCDLSGKYCFQHVTWLVYLQPSPQVRNPSTSAD